MINTNSSSPSIFTSLVNQEQSTSILLEEHRQLCQKLFDDSVISSFARVVSQLTSQTSKFKREITLQKTERRSDLHKFEAELAALKSENKILKHGHHHTTGGGGGGGSQSSASPMENSPNINFNSSFFSSPHQARNTLNNNNSMYLYGYGASSNSPSGSFITAGSPPLSARNNININNNNTSSPSMMIPVLTLNSTLENGNQNANDDDDVDDGDDDYEDGLVDATSSGFNTARSFNNNTYNQKTPRRTFVNKNNNTKTSYLSALIFLAILQREDEEEQQEQNMNQTFEIQQSETVDDSASVVPPLNAASFSNASTSLFSPIVTRNNNNGSKIGNNDDFAFSSHADARDESDLHFILQQQQAALEDSSLKIATLEFQLEISQKEAKDLSKQIDTTKADVHQLQSLLERAHRDHARAINAADARHDATKEDCEQRRADTEALLVRREEQLVEQREELWEEADKWKDKFEEEVNARNEEKERFKAEIVEAAKNFERQMDLVTTRLNQEIKDNEMEFAEKLSQIERSQLEIFEAKSQRQQADQDERLRQLRQDHDHQLENTKSQQENEHSNKMEQLIAEYENRLIQQQQDSFLQQSEIMKKKLTEEIATLEEKHDCELHEQRERTNQIHQQEISQLRHECELQLERQENELRSEKQNEIHRLQQEYESDKKNLESTIENLHQETQCLNEDLQQQLQESEEFQMKIAFLTTSAASAQEELKQLRQELDEIDESKGQQNEEAERRKRLLKRRINQQQQEREQHQAQEVQKLAEMMIKLQQLERKKKQMQQEKQNRMKEQFAEFEKQLQLRYSQQGAQQRETFEMMKSSLSDAVEKIQLQQQQYRKREDSLIQKHKEEMRSLKEKFTAINRNKQDSDVAAVEGLMHRLEQEILDRNQKNQQQENNQQEKTVSGWSKALSQLQNDLSDSCAAMDRAKGIVFTSSAAESESSEHDAKSKEIANSLLFVENVVKSLQTQNQHLQQRLVQASKRNNNSDAETKTQIDRLENLLKAREKENLSLMKKAQQQALESRSREECEKEETRAEFDREMEGMRREIRAQLEVEKNDALSKLQQEHDEQERTDAETRLLHRQREAENEARNISDEHARLSAQQQHQQEADIQKFAQLQQEFEKMKQDQESQRQIHQFFSDESEARIEIQNDHEQVFGDEVVPEFFSIVKQQNILNQKQAVQIAIIEEEEDEQQQLEQQQEPCNIPSSPSSTPSPIKNSTNTTKQQKSTSRSRASPIRNTSDLEDAQKRQELLLRQLRLEKELQAQKDHLTMVELLERLPEDRSRLLSAFRETADLPALWELRAAPRLSQAFEVRSLIFDKTTKRITKIDLSGGKFRGRVHLDMMPDSLEWLDISSNHFEGPLRLGDLPCLGLKYLYINQNHFSGPLELDQLRRLAVLKTFFAYQNQFENGISLLNLPASLEDLNFNSNHKLTGQLVGLEKLGETCPILKGFNCGSCSFHGKLDFANIPESIERLQFHCNKFSGDVDWALLPKSPANTFTHFDAYGNNLEGDIRLGDMPRSLTRIFLQNNNFSSFLDLSQLPPHAVHVDVSANKLNGALQLNRLPRTLLSLSLCCNEFGGFNVHLGGAVKLPPKLESLDISSNKFRPGNVFSIRSGDEGGIPASLKTLVLHSNEFSGTIHVSRKRWGIVTAAESGDDDGDDGDFEEKEENPDRDDLCEMTTLDARWCPNLKFTNDPPDWVRI